MPIKILVVDDETDVALIFRQKFRRRIRKGELSFEFAHNGRHALEFLQADPEFAIVFTDIKMPEMSGLTLLEEIRKLERPLLLPLVVSAYDDMDNIRAAMHNGAFDFICKPIDVDDLALVLDKAMREVEKTRQGIEAAAALAEAEKRREKAEYNKAIQKEFFDNITHELRTPLTLLLGPLEQALGICRDEAVSGHLHRAKRNGQLLLDLVNQLLDFSKIDAEALSLRPQPVDLAQHAQGLAEAFRGLAPARGLDFQVDAAGPLPMQADPAMLDRILLNLLSNAFKFTPEGGRVTLRCAMEGAQLSITVADTGPGISEAQLPHIFDRYFQASSGKTSAYQGTGIGLALTRALVELHGGSIDVDSTPGEGATFCVLLDAEPATSGEGQGPEVAAWVRQHAAAAPQDVVEDDDRPTILLVEDHEDMRDFVRQTLAADYQLVLAENGAIGLQKGIATVPDLVLSDVMMPEMDGLELLQALKSDRATSHVPVILLTARADVAQRIEGLERGADAYLPKPFHPEELKTQVRNLLQLRTQLRAHYKRELLLRPDQVEGRSMEDQFLIDLKQLMEKHLGDEYFGVEQMADAMAMSRRTLGRKLSAITGQAPVKFIRAYRLERGLQMLKQKSATVREVALRTGFGSSSYFTKCFKDHYGYSPRHA